MHKMGTFAHNVLAHQEIDIVAEVRCESCIKESWMTLHTEIKMNMMNRMKCRKFYILQLFFYLKDSMLVLKLFQIISIMR